MSDDYQQLLDATIHHLEELKSRGVRFVPVTSASLSALSQTPQVAPVRKTFVAPAAVPERRPPARLVENPTVPNRAVPEASARPAPAPALDPRPSTLDLQAKLAAFADLRARALACVKCPHLASSRKHVVFGVGSMDAQLMFVGEAPGADEDLQGEPFVGKAGQLLTKIIQTTGLSRADVYIANILKCRPDTPGEASGNRKPTSEEMQTCIPFLHEQIDLIRPRVIVALGATAVEGLLGKTVGITKLRGNWQTYRGTPLMPTYHPAYLLRNQAMSEKRRVWEDMLQVMQKLGMAISEKQQNFFLSQLK